MNCTACDSSHTTASGATVRGIWPGTYKVDRCADCGLYFLPQKPTANDLAAYYRHEYYKLSRLTLAVKVMFRRFRSASQQAYIEKFLPMHGLKILEIGAGEGTFLHFCKKRGAEVYGTEFNQEMRDYAQNHYGIAITDTDFFALEGRYDLLAMSHSLEHFLDVKAVLAKIKTLLKPGGSLFAEVPNSPGADEVSPEVLQDFINTTHIYNFTPASLNKLMTSQGYQVTDLSRHMPNLPLSPSFSMRATLNDKLLKAHRPPLLSWPYLALYLLRSLQSHKSSFSQPPATMPWTMSDNLRVLAKVKTL